MLSPVRVNAPDESPVSLPEAKAHLRVDHDDDDALIGALVEAATGHLDGRTGMLGRAIVTQTWRAKMRCWPVCGRIWLPLGDVSEIVAVKYRDDDDVEQTLAPTDYRGPFVNACGTWIERAPSVAWPNLSDRQDAISIEWKAGFGAAAEVPPAIKQAILLLIGQWYETRETITLGETVVEMPFAVTALISPYRRRVV